MDRVRCPSCGQDWPRWFRIRADGRTILVCRECEATWLPGDDRRQPAPQGLMDLFPPDQVYQAWALIESIDPPERD